MFLKYNGKLKSAARELRKNMTDSEKLLWLKIKGKQIKGAQFYRQKTIGNFIVDFYCPSVKLIIEVDGGQHYEKDGKEKDKARDEYLQSLNLRVLRFTNFEVLKNINGVLKKIYGEIGKNLSQPPFLKGRSKMQKVPCGTSCRSGTPQSTNMNRTYPLRERDDKRHNLVRKQFHF